MKDIETKVDIRNLVDKFYSKLLNDSMISYFFTEVVEIDLELHLPRICSFWNGILLGIAEYKGNAMLKHIELNSVSELKDEHIDRWLEIWNTTIDEDFEGEVAENAKERAFQIGALMKYKVKSDSLI